MHNPTVSTAATTKPEIKPSRDGQSPGWFRNPLPGQAGTTVTAEFLNELLAMIRATLTDGGVAFTDGVDENRLRDAVRAISVAQASGTLERIFYSSAGVTSGTHSLTSGKQFSDYDLILAHVSNELSGGHAGKQTVIFPEAEWTSGAVFGEAIDSSGAHFEAKITYATDTTFTVGGDKGTIIFIYGIKV